MSKFYDKEYYPSDYLTASWLNDLVGKINNFTTLMTSWLPITEGTVETLPTFSNNDFLYVEDFRKLENNVYVIALNFISPERFITPKLWDEETYYNLSYTDLNRIINNMNVLYEHRAERPSIWNFQYNDNWEQPSTIDWEGEI